MNIIDIYYKNKRIAIFYHTPKNRTKKTFKIKIGDEIDYRNITAIINDDCRYLASTKYITNYSRDKINYSKVIIISTFYGVLRFFEPKNGEIIFNFLNKDFDNKKHPFIGFPDFDQWEKYSKTGILPTNIIPLFKNNRDLFYSSSCINRVWCTDHLSYCGQKCIPAPLSILQIDNTGALLDIVKHIVLYVPKSFITVSKYHSLISRKQIYQQTLEKMENDRLYSDRNALYLLNSVVSNHSLYHMPDLFSKIYKIALNYHYFSIIFYSENQQRLIFGCEIKSGNVIISSDETTKFASKYNYGPINLDSKVVSVDEKIRYINMSPKTSYPYYNFFESILSGKNKSEQKILDAIINTGSYIDFPREIFFKYAEKILELNYPPKNYYRNLDLFSTRINSMNDKNVARLFEIIDILHELVISLKKENLCLLIVKLKKNLLNERNLNKRRKLH